jgi:hypothetical protein
MNQRLRPALEQYLNLGFILDGHRDAAAECGVVQHIARLVPFVGRIDPRDHRIPRVQKRLIPAGTPLPGFATGRLARGSRWIGFITVLRSACVAVHARGFIADHGFDRVREYEFAFAAPRVDVAAQLLSSKFSFHKSRLKRIAHCHLSNHRLFSLLSRGERIIPRT